MFCCKCGAQLQADSRFCTSCGNQTGVVNTPSNYYYPKKTLGSGEATASIILGAVAFFLPIPVLDIMVGIAGLILGIVARKKGSEGIAVVGIVISIIGTINALIFTYYVLSGQLFI
ncbi:MAG: hypothetical protein FWE36_04625 [Erysipelotrichales bacterium]|nr:hypothetical protein [Erysipelotrichales bacterium]